MCYFHSWVKQVIKKKTKPSVSVHIWLFFRLMDSYLRLSTYSCRTPTYPKMPESPSPDSCTNSSSVFGPGWRNQELSDESKGLKDIVRLLRNSIGNEGQAPPDHKQGPSWAMVAGGSMCAVAQQTAGRGQPQEMFYPGGSHVTTLFLQETPSQG